MLNVPERPPSIPHSPYSSRSKRLLGAWLGSALGWTDGSVQVKQRGNVLHILCESSTGPDRASLTARLRSALNAGGFLPQLTPEGAIIHRLVLYGRVTEATKPSWGETFELEIAEDGNETTTQQLSHQLSRQLSQYNVAVRVKRKAIDGTAAHRLYVVCESVYSPDLNVIAEPLAECLRSLSLRDCQDAIVSAQVKGESEPDWMVRVDLTPADQMLRSRAQWGDVAAMERLLHPLLKDCCQTITITLETAVLHIVCRHDQITVPQTYVVKRISDFLNEVAPQGIQGASIYGVMNSNAPESQPSKNTHWTHWIDLPAADRIDLSPTPEDLIKRGSLTAIRQLLTQQLNLDLDQQLATGGIRVQVRQRETVLHIMTDALKVPPQDKIVARIKGYLTPLRIEGITGFCIYGRQAGQPQSSWQQGLMLSQVANQQRLVPVSVPEFTASDSYVEDLMSPPGEIVFVPRQPDRNWGGQFEKLRNGAQWILLKTPFFTSVRVNQRITSTADEKLDGRVALVWGILGVCLMVTGDWAIGLMLRSQGLGDLARQEFPEKSDLKSDLKPDPRSLPSLSLNRSGNSTDSSAFNSSEFTSDKKIAKGSKISLLNVVPFKVSANPSKSLNTTPLIDPGLDAKLPSSPLQPKAAVDLARSPYSNLSSPQLNERLALYQQYVSAYGVPDVLVVGSSRALRGIDPSALQEDLTQKGLGNLRVFNFGVNGATAQVVDLVLRRLIAPDQLPRTIVWADGARAFNSGRTDITYNAIAASSGYRKLPEHPISPQTQATDPVPPEAPKSLSDRYRALDEVLQSWVNGLSSGGRDRDTVINLAREKILGNPIARSKNDNETSLTNNEGMTDVNGFLSLSNQFNPATYYQKYSKVSGTFDSDYDSFSLQGKQQDALRNITSFTQARKISLVFVNLPLTSEYLDLRRSEYENEFTRSMAESATQLKFTYRDLSKALDQENALFSDPSHLNRYGAYVVAQRLANDAFMPWRRGDRKN